jgi:hypothetical protein
MISAEGKDGTVTFDGQTLTINREGRKWREFGALFTRGIVRSKTMRVPLEKIAEIKYIGTEFIVKAPGHVHFMGGKTKPANVDYPLTVRIGRDATRRAQFEALRDAVNQALAGRSQPPQA